MLRLAAPLLALHFLAMLCLPTGVLLHFQWDRARIQRELCVQRSRVEGMRTCHGECQLSKRLHALEAAAEKDFPSERLRVRYEPVVDMMADPGALIRNAGPVQLLEPVFPLADGHGRSVEHVPKG
jgi:hypothetical protein